MISEGRFPIPERIQLGGESSVVGYLDGLASELVERLSRQLGPEFEVRPERPEHDFGGGRWWQIGIHRGSRLEAAVTLDWSQGASPGHFDLQWQEIKPFDTGAAAAAACSAAASLALGWSLSLPVALAAMLVAAPIGAAAWVAWRRLPGAARAETPGMAAIVRGGGAIQIGA